jgi:tetratricopeptide (TPR) repeat protein
LIRPDSTTARPFNDLRAQTVSRVILIVLLTVLAYLPVWHAGFIWDDDDYVTQNATLRNLAGLKLIWLNPATTPQYYPLVYTTFWMEYHLWHLHPLGYHLVNVLLHALSAVLLWRILVRLCVPGALLASLIFALHPVCVESVAWVSERKNVLSGVCYFMAALAYLRFTGPGGDVETGEGSPAMGETASGGLSANASRRSGFDLSRGLWLVGAFILYLAALLSKTVTCSLPAALLLVQWWRKGRLGMKDVLPLIPFFLVGAGLGLGTAWLEKNHVGAVGPEWDLTSWQRCLIAGRALWFYAAKLAWPADLSFVYPHWEIHTNIWWQWLFPAAAVGVIMALWGLRHQWGRGPVVAVLFFAGTLFPALGFVNAYPMIYSFVADHFQYLASIGLMVLAAAGLKRLLGRWAYVLPVVLGVLTWQKVHVYRDPETLWQDTLARNPTCWLALNNLGEILRGQGKLDDAAANFQKAIILKPDVASAWNNLGDVFDAQGRKQAAMYAYVRAIQFNPYLPEALANLASLLTGAKRYDEALPLYQRALQINPNYVVIRICYANTLVVLGRFNEAAAQFDRACHDSPDDAGANAGLAKLLARQGRYDEAIVHFKRVVKAEPNDPTAYYNLGGILSMEGRMDDAIQQYEAALRLKPDYVAAHNNLGIAYASRGSFATALDEFNTVLRLEPTNALACNNAAVILDKLGRSREAIPYLLKAVQLNPGNQGARQRLHELGVTTVK